MASKNIQIYEISTFQNTLLWAKQIIPCSEVIVNVVYQLMKLNEIIFIQYNAIQDIVGPWNLHADVTHGSYSVE